MKGGLVTGPLEESQDLSMPRVPLVRDNISFNSLYLQ
jgi:hypothetical protein